MHLFIDRITRAARLDIRLFEEVEKDQGAFGQAMIVVLLSSAAAGVATVETAGLNGIFIGTLTALIAWFIWAYLTFIIGTKVLPEPQTRAEYGELLRTIGFASSPGIIRILGLIPGLSRIVFLIAGLWMLIAMVIAVRQALDYRSTLRAVGVCIVGWIIQGLLFAAVLSLFGVSLQPAQPS